MLIEYGFLLSVVQIHATSIQCNLLANNSRFAVAHLLRVQRYCIAPELLLKEPVSIHSLAV